MPFDDDPASVLVVDDSDIKRRAICALIESMHLRATAAASGRDALRLLLKQDFAVILLDVRMPGMSGLETAELIHSRPRSAHTPVIFLTAEAASEADRSLGYTAGAADYIASPIIPEVLRAKVRVFVNLHHMQRRLLRQTRELQESRQMLRQLALHQERVKEEERKRIAREVHDELGQNLLALRIDAALLEARTAGSHANLNRRAQLALTQIDATMRSVRNIINDLRPPVLDLGLLAAIEWQVSEFRRRSGIECSIEIGKPSGTGGADVDFDAGLDECRALALFRILQESLTNVLRHARANRVRILLGRHPEQLMMQIIDNGVGIAPQAVDKNRSFGLPGIRERLHTLNGTLEVHSAPGAGTALFIAIPLETTEREVPNFRNCGADNPDSGCAPTPHPFPFGS
ncbi:ATP-binding response regulator [Noviherbaspirillum pedocola]|uniref:Oxygen sensor histidine kinase NreB n=1 Tax=Noviherbaspirillum pedocola TaxID=2801341 RepID=A0A934SR61_9BURK|nr:response regulator [Noviherbaspirillum pedocola]MBK4734032.1 response regulator [Noviherbaspirillum pedocola]